MIDKKLLEKIGESVSEAIRPNAMKGAAIKPEDLEILNKGICILEKIKKIESLDKQIEYMDSYGNDRYNSYNSYDDGNSYRRGRSATTGRYVSRDSAPYVDGYSSRRFYDGNGYSGHSIKDRMIAQLEKMYDEAQTEHEKQIINDEIRRLDSGN